MKRLDESYISAESIENAKSEGTLKELIADYINFGGEMDDIYSAIEGTEISKEEIDSAKEELYSKGMLDKEPKRDEHPVVSNITYSLDTGDIFLDKIDKEKAIEGAKKLIKKEDTTEIYLSEDMEDSNGENKTECLLYAYKDPDWVVITDTLDIFSKTERGGRKKSTKVNESLVEELNYDGVIKSLQDIVSELSGNVSEEQLDDEIKTFNRYARKLRERDFDTIQVLVTDEDDEEVDLNYNSKTSGEPINDFAKYYPNEGAIQENLNGYLFIYFKNSDSLNQYLRGIKAKGEVLNSEVEFDNELDERLFVNEEEEEPTSKVFDIKECLNDLDKKTNNRYNLLTRYQSQPLTSEQKEKLGRMLSTRNESLNAPKIYKYLKEDCGCMREYCDDEGEAITILEDTVKMAQGKIVLKEGMNEEKVTQWLDDNGYFYDKYNTNEGTVIEWIKDLDKVMESYTTSEVAHSGETDEEYNRELIQEMVDKVSDMSSALCSAASTKDSITDYLREHKHDIESLRNSLNESFDKMKI